MSAQLQLIKSKMSYKSGDNFTMNIDQQTSNVSQQLNSLNERLKGKQSYNHNNQLNYQQPRNRSIPTPGYEPVQPQREGYNTYSSYGTNNTNFANQRNLLYAPPTNNKQNDFNKPYNYEQTNNKLSYGYDTTHTQQLDVRRLPYNQMSQVNKNSTSLNTYNSNYKQSIYQGQKQQDEPLKPQMRQNQPPRNPIDDLPAVARHPNVNRFKVVDEVADDDDVELVECPEGCGRQFKQEALEKHVRVCKKVFQSKRKEFNSKARRIVSQEQVKLQKQGQVKEKQIIQIQKKQRGNDGDPKWKKQSEQFRQMIQANRQGARDVQYKNPYEDDYVECNGCGRRFNQRAAEKHIPSCQSKQKINRFKMRR